MCVGESLTTRISDAPKNQLKTTFQLEMQTLTILSHMYKIQIFCAKT